MEESIKKIFNNNIILLNSIDKVIYNLKTQNFDRALRTIPIIIDQLGSLIELLISNEKYFNEEFKLVEVGSIMNMLTSLLNAQEDQDYILLADLYEIQVSPYILSLQEAIEKKEKIVINEEYYLENIKLLDKKDKELSNLLKRSKGVQSLLDGCGYTIEYTSCGLMTLATEINNRWYYMHSNHKVQNEASTLASSWYEDDKNHYIVYGLGLGYHIKELISIDKDIIIDIYEGDINVIKLACTFTDMSFIFNNPQISLCYDRDCMKLAENIKDMDENKEFVIHYPSLRRIENVNIKNKLEKYFIQYSSVKNQLHLLNRNFKKNISNYDYFVDELETKFQGKDLYIIAAGPSLDKNFMLLKKVQKDGIILATGTVFRKLLNAGIVPDYVIVTDANDRVYAQIAGLEEQTVPMIILSTAFYGFASNYKGKKYMVCQKDYPKAEKLAEENNIGLFRTGGSVSTTALDIGINFGCRKIIFLGLDLGYTGNFVHAKGTSRRDLASTENLRETKDVNGNTIHTNGSLDMYKQWIERRIKEVHNIKIIDATEGGAKIEGMEIAQLEKVIASD